MYKIEIPNSGLDPFNVWCDFFDDHGWTVIQKRFDGSVDFFFIGQITRMDLVT